MTQKLVLVESEQVTALMFGICDVHAKRIENRFRVRIMNRHPDNNGGDALVVEGEIREDVDHAVSTLQYIKRMAEAGTAITEQSLEYVMSMIADGASGELDSLDGDVICITTRGRPIKPRTVGQKKYVDSIKKNTVILGVGPAGTGKTFLAVAMAVDALRNKQVSRIVLTRPAVEAGEKLGFLPGDLQNKIDPYLRPLNDALYEMLGPDNYARQIEKNAIEIAPLAYMRGRTLDDSFIILDEAQNTTPEQMKMFLTRLGNNSKAVVTGDPSQTDLPFGKKSGLGIAVKILRGIEGIAVHTFTERDVVRHHLVQKIILAYDKYEREHAGAVYRAKKEQAER